MHDLRPAAVNTVAAYQDKRGICCSAIAYSQIGILYLSAEVDISVIQQLYLLSVRKGVFMIYKAAGKLKEIISFCKFL